jgi:hypothetical protein
MNVSWHDLNNIDAPGDYPFRDGTITVTFAEIATWKADPGAQFQLMRKYPLEETARYALGRQLDPPVRTAKLIYQSSNGDSWSLTRDPTSGVPAVMHQPNRQSGGQVSYIELQQFLSADSGGPEHQALTRLMEEKAKPATILIAYDIHPPEGEVRDRLVTAIRSLGMWWHHLETVWLVRCSQTPLQIRDRLQSLM